MTDARLYHDLAQYWPLISEPEEYAEAAGIIRATLREKLGDGPRALLDLGVGGGHLLSHLTADFDAAGVDLSAEMLAQSRALNPTVEHHIGDMRSIRLDRKFDAVLIHDAILYLLSEADLRSTLQTAKAHLRPGGVLIMCPDWFREYFPDGFVSHRTRRRGDTSLTYIEYVYDPDPADTTVQTIMFFVIRDGGEVRVEQDTHTLGVFEKQTWLALTEEAGFTVETRPYVKADYGQMVTMIVGVRDSSL